MVIESEKKPKTLADIEKDMREKFPGLSESEIVGSEAWKIRVQVQQAPYLIEKIEGAGKAVKTPKVSEIKKP